MPSINLLDDSWILDIAYRYSRGNWLGRDVLFTYGPLYELMMGLPSRILHQSEIGFIYRTWSLIPIVVSILLVYGIGALLLGSEPAWKRLLFFLAVLYFWCPFDVRAILVLFIFAVFVRAITQLEARTMLLWAAVTVFLIIVAFLVSADAGFYSGAALALVVLCAFCFRCQSPRLLFRFSLTTAILLVVGVFVVNALAARFFDFRLWRGALEQASNYRWAMSLGLQPEMLTFIKVIIFATILAFGSAWMFRQVDSSALTRRPLFLCSGFCIAILCLQSGLVRSNWTQVWPAAFPAVVMIGLILLGTGPVRRPISFLLIGLMLAVSLFVATIPSHRLWAFRLLANNWNLQLVDGECPSGTVYFQQACVSVPQFQILGRSKEFLKGSADPKTFVFPYQNILAVAAQKLVAGGVLQSYAAYGGFLMDQQITSLQHERPELAIYGVDDVASWRVDEVSNFSRSPKVWFYLQQSYRFDSTLSGGFVGLRRDDERTKNWKEVRGYSVDFRPRVVKVSGSGIYDLGNVGWAIPYDFLRFEVRFTYPSWWKLSKPSAVAFVLHFSDGTVKSLLGYSRPIRVPNSGFILGMRLNCGGIFYLIRSSGDQAVTVLL